MTDHPATITGDELTDDLVAVVEDLANAIIEQEDDTIAAARDVAEDLMRDSGRDPAAAGWAVAVVAAAMLPTPTPSRVLLAWLQRYVRTSTDKPRRSTRLLSRVDVATRGSTAHTRQQ
jgi:hypothetical protein